MNRILKTKQVFRIFYRQIAGIKINMKKSVLAVGSVAFDDVKTPFGERQNSIGGSAIFFSMAASHFTEVQIIGVAGEDFPQETIDLLQKHQIDTQGLSIVSGKTFRWGGVYHDDINIRDTLYTHLNVFADFQPTLPDSYRNTPFVFLGNIQPSLQLEVLRQLHQPEFVALDTMNLWINTTHADLMKVIARVKLLIINEDELNLLSGESNLLNGLQKVHQMGPPFVIVKKGEHGAYLSCRNSLFFTPAFPVRQPTDPTGAGDSFAGGFIGYLTSCKTINFRNMKKALIYGSILGSLAVEHFSIDGITTLPRAQIENRYQTLRKMVSI
jgi:sugar/nucleoside kinase (ribokinase family)